MYGTLQVLGPEHEFSVVDEKLQPLPIVDKVIKNLHGRVVNYADFGDFTLGKELQAHVAEFKANRPFSSPKAFEETMHSAVLKILDFLGKRYHARLLGLGMHPFLKLNEARVWSHRDRNIYEALGRIFNLNQHGWLNIQSFQLNLSYANENEAVRLYNALAEELPYLPAIASSSPIYESKFGEFSDNRLYFYEINQREIPSITGDIIPEPVGSFEEYEKTTVGRYSEDLAKVNAPKCILYKEWLNSRGAVFRFDRRAVEIRIMDEQECVKSDVALSCFIRASLRGILRRGEQQTPHKVRVENLGAVIRDGLEARVLHSKGSTAREVCRYLLNVAEKEASNEERRYLWVVRKRIDEGSLSNIVRRNVVKRMQRTSPEEAMFSVYSALTKCLEENKVYT